LQPITIIQIVGVSYVLGSVQMS